MNAEAKASVEVTAKDLQGPGVVFCPNPKMPLWSGHPRVFIDVASTGDTVTRTVAVLFARNAESIGAIEGGEVQKFAEASGFSEDHVTRTAV